VAVIGAGRPTVLAILLLAVAVAVLWSREHPPREAALGQGDVPVRLVRWAVGLLPTERAEWGQAMLGELDHVENRSSRWRFALGCAAGIVRLPPWESVGPLAALVAVALGSAVVLGIGFVHFGLAANPWNWVMLAIVAALVTGSVVAVRVLLVRPGVARQGLACGCFVAAAWLAVSEFTWTGIVNPIYSVSVWSDPALLIAAPLVVGVAGAWRSGSASAGRRTARLAGVSAGLAMFFVSTIAVVAIGGGPRDPGVGVARGVSEAFSNVALLYLIALPVAMTVTGWVAATATARIRSMSLGHLSQGPMSTPPIASGHAGDPRWRHTSGPTRRRVAVVSAFVLAVVILVLAR
jgi:hypothetical protein